MPIAKPANFQDWKALPSKAVLQEIGRLAILITGIEDLIHCIIWRYLNVDDQVGSLITAKWKTKQLQENCLSYLKALRAPSSVINDLSDIFSQLQKSAELRNKCVHWIWHYSRRGTKGIHRLDPPSYQQDKLPVYYSAKQIRLVSDDLVWLETRLYPHALDLDQLYGEFSWGDHDDMPVPWLCIFPQPERDPN